MELPGSGVEETNKTGLADATAEERIGRECAEGVVSDLGVSGGCATVDEGEVVVCGEDRGVEEDQPYIYADGGLEQEASLAFISHVLMSIHDMEPHHAVFCALDTLVNDLPSYALESTTEVAICGTVADDLGQGQMTMREDRFCGAGSLRVRE